MRPASASAFTVNTFAHVFRAMFRSRPVAAKPGHHEVATTLAAVYEASSISRPTGLSVVPIAAPAHLEANASPPSSLVIADWDDLFHAATRRLRVLVGSEVVERLAPPTHAKDSWVQAGVLECVDALDLLHTALGHERCRRASPGTGMARAIPPAPSHDLEAWPAKVGTVERVARLEASAAAAAHRSTGLPPQSALDRLLQHHEVLGVLHVRLDGGEPLHRTHGDVLGSELLRIFSARLTRAVRPGDIVACVEQDDEFVCLLADNPSRERLARLACKLLDAMSGPAAVRQLRVGVHASVGIATSPSGGDTAPQLLTAAAAAARLADDHQAGYAFFGEPAEPRVRQLEFT